MQLGIFMEKKQPQYKDLDDTAELNQRSDGFIEVKLMYHRPTETVYITLEEIARKHAYAFVVDAALAGDAFIHPYPYMAGAGLMAEGQAA